MVKEMEQRLKACKIKKDMGECDGILCDMVLYILENRWDFVLDIIYPPFDNGDGGRDGMLVLKRKDSGNGYFALYGVFLSDIKKGCAECGTVGFKEKTDFIKKTLALIPIQ